MIITDIYSDSPAKPSLVELADGRIFRLPRHEFGTVSEADLIHEPALDNQCLRRQLVKFSMRRHSYEWFRTTAVSYGFSVTPETAAGSRSRLLPHQKRSSVGTNCAIK